MKLRDFTWLKEEDILFRGSGRCEILGARLVSTLEQAGRLPAGQLAVVPGKLFLEEEGAEALLRALACSAAAIGIQWPGNRETLSRLPLLNAALSDGGCPAFYIPPQIGLEQLFTEIAQETGSFFAQTDYQKLTTRLSEISAGGYDTGALLSFLSEELECPADCFAGQPLAPVASYPSRGIFDLRRFIRDHARQLLSGPLAQAHSHGGICVWTFNLENPSDCPAVLAVMLPQGTEMDLSSLQTVREVIPYLRLSTLFECRAKEKPADPKKVFFGTIMNDMGEGGSAQAGLWESARQLGLKQNTPYYVWIFDASPGARPDTKDRILSYILAKEPDCVFNALGQRYVFITRAGALEETGAADAFFRDMLAKAGGGGPNAGDYKISVGQVCRTIESLGHGFWEAWVAMALGRQMDPDASLYRYSQYILYHLLCDIWDNPILARIPQKSVDRLIAYDQKNKTQLFPTLRTLLDNDFNVYLTATRMNAHRNTIHKRVGRINSLLDIDLNFYRNRTLLQVAVMEKALMGRAFKQ